MRRVTSTRAASSEIPRRWAAAGSGFENQGSLDDGDGVRMAAADFFEPFVLVINHRGMNNFVELFYAWRRTAGTERGFGQSGAVNGSVGVQDLSAKAADYFFVDGVTRLHERVSDGIGLDHVRAALGEYLADCGLAAGDAAG
jgi:hypothetical protein